MKRLGGKLWYSATALKKREINDLKVFSILYQGQEEVSQQERFPAVVLSVLQT